jgi:DNA-binding PadR family transcriptional regulator
MTPPVFAHGHLRLYLLSLLDTAPMHGYELIQALGERFGGTYVPSAGTIYPRLAKLEEEGLVTKSTDGRKTVYAITDAGRAELADRQSELNDIENDVTDSVRRLADEVRSSVNAAMKSLRADLAAAAREARAEARESGRSSQAEQRRTTNSGRLREAELILDEFRHNARTDLRGLAARGGIPDDVVTTLKARLDAVRDELTGTPVSGRE